MRDTGTPHTPLTGPQPSGSAKVENEVSQLPKYFGRWSANDLTHCGNPFCTSQQWHVKSFVLFIAVLLTDLCGSGCQRLNRLWQIRCRLHSRKHPLCALLVACPSGSGMDNGFDKHRSFAWHVKRWQSRQVHSSTFRGVKFQPRPSKSMKTGLQAFSDSASFCLVGWMLS